MNCIFICVFHNPKYVDMLFLLLDSIYTFGQLDSNTDILIYTTSGFAKTVADATRFKHKIRFLINDTYTSIQQACVSRLDLFRLLDELMHTKRPSGYSKILYLDTDIIVKRPLTPLFELAKKNVLYTLEEGSIVNKSPNFWGGNLFSDAERAIHADKSAFTSGILLFKNCPEIRNLFDVIKRDLNERKTQNAFYDQPFIVYNAFKHNLFDNKVLRSYAVNRSSNIYSPMILHHFSGGVGKDRFKTKQMIAFLMLLKRRKIC